MKYRLLAAFASVFLLATSLVFAQSTLTIVRPSDSVSLDPQFDTTSTGTVVFSQILEPLITISHNMEIEPRLATAWEVIDSTRIRFTLRQGVSFHDGTPFNAEAVKFTWDRAFNSEPPGLWASLAGPIKGVEIIDDYTVDIVSTVPYGPLLYSIALPSTGIVSPTAVEALGADFARNPVGTGPFKFVEWRTNDRVVLEANPDYWRGRPALDTVIFRTVPEEGARTLALLAGEADLDIAPSPSSLPTIEGNPDFDVQRVPGIGVFSLNFNLDRPLVSDPSIRHAIAHAIDRELIVETILEGNATVPRSVLGEPVFGFVDMAFDELYPYDPDRAVELLTEAGYERRNDGLMYDANGEVLRLKMLPSNGRIAKDLDVAEIIQEFLRQVGIVVELDVFEWSTTFSLIKGETLDYDMAAWTWFTQTADADYTLYPHYVSTELPPNSWNGSRYSNETVDALAEEGRGSGDLERRAVIYEEIQHQLALDLPTLPIFGLMETAVVSTDIEGFQVHPIQYILELFPVGRR